MISKDSPQLKTYDSKKYLKQLIMENFKKA